MVVYGIAWGRPWTHHCLHIKGRTRASLFWHTHLRQCEREREQGSQDHRGDAEIAQEVLQSSTDCFNRRVRRVLSADAPEVGE